MITTCYTSNRADKLDWVHVLPESIPYVFIIGNPDLKDEYKYDKESHRCVLRCSDEYLGLPEKIKAGFNFVHKEFNPKFLIKVDDDVIVNVSKLIVFLNSLKQVDYAGVVTCINNYAYCGGPMYYLSNRTLEHMIDMNIDAPAEDYCVGRCANLKSIPIYNYHLYTHYSEKINNHIAYHDHDRIIFKKEDTVVNPNIITPPVPKNTKRLSFLPRI